MRAFSSLNLVDTDWLRKHARGMKQFRNTYGAWL